MPPFIKGGPDIPLGLLQSHEEGRVVFFCGSGISIPAGLPGFKELVTKISEKIREPLNDQEKKLHEKEQYDRVIELYEQRCCGYRQGVRKAVYDILTLQNVDVEKLETHSALLRLAKDRAGTYRLITTNFDRLFNAAMNKDKCHITEYSAPLLPICKGNKWNGIVYLHGLFPEQFNASALDKIVLSSGDFGLAYLGERWASRFVSELFRNYTVCFVGYSLQDPILRYMMDALAADRLLGESSPEAFVFAPYSRKKNAKTSVLRDWRAKWVTPILYDGRNKHKSLHCTLKDWSERYRDGLNGKKNIITTYSFLKPSESSSLDHGIGQVLWALRDSQAANHFATIEPPPPIEWLNVLEKPWGTELVRGDMPQATTPKKQLSLLKKPVDNDGRGQNGVVVDEIEYPRLDPTMSCLARWLVKHVDTSELIKWVVRQGGVLHRDFKVLLEERITKKDAFNISNPASQQRKEIWKLFLMDRVRSSGHTTRIDHLLNVLKNNNDAIDNRITHELLRCFDPCIAISRAFSFLGENESHPSNQDKQFQFDLILRGIDTRETISDLEKLNGWKEFLRNNIFDLSLKLRDAYAILTTLTSYTPLSLSNIASIADHGQNIYANGWTVLITMVRDSWQVVARADPIVAKVALELWNSQEAPIFKRLLFHALANQEFIPKSELFRYITQDGGAWLWELDTRREVLQLLAALPKKISGKQLKQLEDIILAGPRGERFEDLSDEAKEKMIWHRLKRLKHAGMPLDEMGMKQWLHLEEKYLGDDVPNEREEFSIYVTMGPLEDKRYAPTEPDKLAEWLIATQNEDPYQRDNWSNICTEHFDTACNVLAVVAAKGTWPKWRWVTALSSWSDENDTPQQLHKLMPLIFDMPDDTCQEIGTSLSF